MHFLLINHGCPFWITYLMHFCWSNLYSAIYAAYTYFEVSYNYNFPVNLSLFLFKWIHEFCSMDTSAVLMNWHGSPFFRYSQQMTFLVFFFHVRHICMLLACFFPLKCWFVVFNICLWRCYDVWSLNDASGLCLTHCLLNSMTTWWKNN